MITEKQKKKIATSIQSLEETVSKFLNIFCKYMERDKEIPITLLDPYYTMKDRLEKLYETQRQERIKETKISQNNYNYTTRAIS